MRRALLLAALAACGDTTTTPLSQLNLDRPVDVAFGCFGGLRITGGGASTKDQPIDPGDAQPFSSCDIRSGAVDPTTQKGPVPPGQEDLTMMGGDPIGTVNWYAFVLQSVPGTVNIWSFPTQPAASFATTGFSAIDSDPLTPGVNGISVGEDPVGIATDKVGCYEVIANAGSCDLSALDIASAVDDTPGARVDRMPVMTANGPLLARPAAIVAEPAGGTIGVTCGMQPSGLVYIAYPSCHTVAAVDVSTGNVTSHIDFDATGKATIVAGSNLSCPAECGASGAITPGTRPIALDLKKEARVGRVALAIGADNSNQVTIVDLDGSSLPTKITQIPLLNTTGTIGITAVTLSPQIGMGGVEHMIDDATAPGGQSQFVYAITTDNTVRVADILSLNKECDAQVDPRFLHDSKDVKFMSCMPVGDPLTPPRRATAKGPGIELVGDDIPTSINVFRVDQHGGGDPDHPGEPVPANLIGYFGIITSAAGRAWVLNIDDDDHVDFVGENNGIAAVNEIASAIPLDIAHQLRDSVVSRDAIAEAPEPNNTSVDMPVCADAGEDPDGGTPPADGPRATANPALILPPGEIAPEKVSQLPSIRQVKCVGQDAPNGTPVSELIFSAQAPPPDTLAVRDQEFPDLRGLRGDETWTLTWEGPLSQDALSFGIDGPQIRESQMFTDSTDLRVDDQTKPFCDSGVEPFDILQFKGCDPSLGNADCPLGYTCYVHPESQVAGLGSCMLSTEADRLANACREFLISQRTYTILKSTSGELTLIPRKHVLATTPLDGCTSDTQCQQLAKYALQLQSSANPVDDRTPDDPHKWACALDPDRAPLAKFPSMLNSGKRCIESCTTDADCSVGTVCNTGFCIEGPLPPQSCINAPQRYELMASEAFTAIGTKSGYIHPIVADSNGNCVKDPTASPKQIGRIPIAPRDPVTGALAQCDPTANPITGQRTDGTLEPDPCFETTDEYDNQPTFAPGTCALGTPNQVTRPTGAIKFRGRGMTLTIVDPTYPGDATCIGDRMGSLANVPTLVPGTQLAFRVTGGLQALLLQISASLPIKVVHGPQESIWVVDEGDFISESITLPSNRGQVFRIESTSLSTINIIQ